MRYVCQICGYVYDDAKEKVPFAQLPETWKCPLCGAAKSDFKPQEAPKAAPVSASVTAEAKPTRLTVGELSVLCSNLARGCEKQYRSEEAGLFRQLADYFTSITPGTDSPSVDKLASELIEDIDNYPAVRGAADAAGDRGAARICVWGEKVTRMLSSLVNRYLKEGESMMEGTEIWVCSVCGFVYIGDTPPEICPVCKVPSWKFDKAEGRL